MMKRIFMYVVLYFSLDVDVYLHAQVTQISRPMITLERIGHQYSSGHLVVKAQYTGSITVQTAALSYELFDGNDRIGTTHQVKAQDTSQFTTNPEFVIPIERSYITRIDYWVENDSDISPLRISAEITPQRSIEEEFRVTKEILSNCTRDLDSTRAELEISKRNDSASQPISDIPVHVRLDNMYATDTSAAFLFTTNVFSRLWFSTEFLNPSGEWVSYTTQQSENPQKAHLFKINVKPDSQFRVRVDVIDENDRKTGSSLDHTLDVKLKFKTEKTIGEPDVTLDRMKMRVTHNSILVKATTKQPAVVHYRIGRKEPGTTEYKEIRDSAKKENAIQVTYSDLGQVTNHPTQFLTEHVVDEPDLRPDWDFGIKFRATNIYGKTYESSSWIPFSTNSEPTEFGFSNAVDLTIDPLGAVKASWRSTVPPKEAYFEVLQNREVVFPRKADITGSEVSAEVPVRALADVLDFKETPTLHFKMSDGKEEKGLKLRLHIRKPSKKEIKESNISEEQKRQLERFVTAVENGKKNLRWGDVLATGLRLLLAGV